MNIISGIQQEKITYGTPIFIGDGERRRASLAFQYRRGKVILGFNQKKSKEIVDIQKCRLITESLNNCISWIRNLLEELCAIPFTVKSKKKKRNKEVLTQGDVLICEAENGIDIVLEFDKELDLAHRMIISEYAQKKNDILRISHRYSNQANTTETIIEKQAPYIKISEVNIEIPAGGFLVLEQDASFTFGISSSNGDEISLFDSKGNLIDKMAVPVMEDGKSYGRLTDGGTQTGIMANPTKGAANDSTPGDGGQEPEDPDTPVNPAETTVFINEAMSSPAGDDEDFIELYNASDNEADISGFILQDDKGEEEEFVIPDGTVIPAKGFVAFTKDEAGSFTFGLGAGGDKVTLLDSGRNILDSVELPDFGDTEGSSYARTEDGAGEWAITENPTKGVSNNN